MKFEPENQSEISAEMRGALEKVLEYLKKQPRNWQLAFVARLCAETEINVVKWMDGSFEATDCDSDVFAGELIQAIGES